VPHDISVIGYDDSTLIAFTDPPLTTIRQRVLSMGEATVEALVDKIAGNGASRSEYGFRPELIVRASTGACRLRQPRVSSRRSPGRGGRGAAEGSRRHR